MQENAEGQRASFFFPLSLSTCCFTSLYKVVVLEGMKVVGERVLRYHSQGQWQHDLHYSTCICIQLKIDAFHTFAKLGCLFLYIRCFSAFTNWFPQSVRELSVHGWCSYQRERERERERERIECVILSQATGGYTYLTRSTMLQNVLNSLHIHVVFSSNLTFFFFGINHNIMIL